MSSLTCDPPVSPINYHSVPQDSLTQAQRECRNQALDNVDLTAPANAPPGNNSFVSQKHKPNIWSALTDASVIVAPLLFLIFAIYVWLLDSREVDAAMLARLRNVITVLATIFPILFAFVIGRLVYEIARWKLDKGATVGTLDQLIRSQTVGATILTQAKLSALNPLGISLLFVWAFSPLGAQSVLQMLGSPLRPTSQNSTIVHYDTNVEPLFTTRTGPPSSLIPNAISDNAWLTTLYNSYTTLLLTPQAMKVDTMDIWMNVKIPFLDIQTNRSGDTWKDSLWNPSLNTYSSLAGILVSNVPVGNIILPRIKLNSP